MEVHAPEARIHSLRDFFVHLLMITMGILIALGLDGIREVVHDHRLVAEARANIRGEIDENRALLQNQEPKIQELLANSEYLLKNLATLSQNPRAAAAALDKMGANFVVLKSTARETALSVGALSLMDYDEVRRYANAYSAQGAFVEMQARLQAVWFDLSAFEDLEHLTSEQRTNGIARLRVALAYLQTLQQTTQQVLQAYAEAGH
jgi:hypothetical protein